MVKCFDRSQLSAFLNATNIGVNIEVMAEFTFDDTRSQAGSEPMTDYFKPTLFDRWFTCLKFTEAPQYLFSWKACVCVEKGPVLYIFVSSQADPRNKERVLV